ncbi:MAG: RNA polymerase subunit sigma-70 [Acidobacteria bacterium]|nr:MAG: RNA polymerase subunit sigma-70 [Acidobacteriota bacterium]
MWLPVLLFRIAQRVRKNRRAASKFSARACVRAERNGSDSQGAVKRGDPSNTLSATALVNEAWLKLAKSPRLAATSRLHFKRIAARAMRQLLIEAARRRKAHKRGGDGEAIFVSFDDSFDRAATPKESLIALDTALTELARLEPRQALIVESRFFGGLEISEISTLIGVSEATILRDWRAAKAWLGQAIRRAE